MKIVCIGDSITFGYGVKNTENWVSILNNNIKIDFINKGLNGDTSSGMLFRSYEDIIRLNPNAVFIMGGTNDFLMNYDWNKTLENIIYLSRDPSIAKTFWDPFVDYEKINIKINNYRKNIIEFCKSEDLDFFDFFTLFNDCKDEWDSLYVDGIHPSAKGHKLISEKIHL
ncbi:GDSL-type esterase/lipase family protein [Clostridium tetani]|uniref:GDSL-type esterase/lipase family protein n=1 Tax=Clostridium tetani TaxID=1513 RepID=UPI0003C0CC2E|nr:GDSL-type esterase/lipase family protein [Clostridium tetani]CDI48940.1 arylesterase [Clostridium tetani 12124569]